MNKLFVWLVGLAAPLWQRLGADPVALKLILSARLKMSDRGSRVLNQQQATGGGYEWIMYLVFLFFGLVALAAFFLIPHTPTAMGLVYSVMMVYLGLILVMEMSETLFDPRDLYLIMSRPVNNITFSLSRALHVASLIGKYALIILFPLTVALPFFANPLLLIPHLLGGVLLVIFIVGGTLALYLTLLRRIPPARFRKMIGYLQMVFSTVFVFIYLAPNILDSTDIDPKSLQLVGEAWGFVFPGLWLGALWGYADLLAGNWMMWAQTLLAVGGAAGAMLYYVGQSRGFGERLLEMSLAGSQEEETAVPRQKNDRDVSGSPWRDRLGPWLTKPGLERASFNFHWSMMSRTMAFKQRVYPGLVFVPIMIFIFFLRDAFNDGVDFRESSGQLLIGLYYVSIALITPLTNLRITDKIQTGWIWQVTPYASRTGPVSYGQLAAATSQFLVPTIIDHLSGISLPGGLVIPGRYSPQPGGQLHRHRPLPVHGQDGPLLQRPGKRAVLPPSAPS